MKYNIEIDLFKNEKTFCDLLSKLLGVELPKEEYKRLLHRRKILEKRPEKALHYLDYIYSIVEEYEEELDEEGEEVESSEIVLTDYQTKILNKVHKLLTTEKFLVLSGYAGVGKTTLLKFLNYHSIQFLAPTNKAASVLNKKLATDKNKEPCITIHKWMKITPKQKEEEIVWKAADKNRILSSLRKLSILVIDESSMLNQELLKLIEELIKTPGINVRVLFVGDAFQLPPVGEDRSHVFDYKTVKMTKIVRQAKDSPIIKASMGIRKGIKNKNRELIFKSLSEFETIDYSSAHYEMFKNLEDDPYLVRLISYTNKSVEQHNRIIKQKLGSNPNLFEEGDLATAYSPIFLKADQDLMLRKGMICTDNFIPSYFVSDDFWIQDVEDTMIMNPCITLEYQKKLNTFALSSFGIRPELELKRFTMRYSEDGSILETYALDNLSILQELAHIGRESKEPLEKNAAWKMFWNLKALSEIKPGYALTCHKVQGSTFKNTIIDVDNLKTCKSFNTLGRLLYVATTRASDNVYIL